MEWAYPDDAQHAVLTDFFGNWFCVCVDRRVYVDVMSFAAAPLRGARLRVALIVAMVVVGTLLLNLRVDHLWQNYPEQSGPCLAQKEAACRHGFVN